MPYFTSKTGNEELQIFYEDLGKGETIVFIHGWPLSGASWEYQMTPLREQGYRCIAYDRRGFGKSDQSLNNYDYNVLAEDLKNLLDELDVDNVTLVGFSMGGGEIVRYCSKYNNARVSRIILVSSIIPYMLQTEDNPEGVPMETFQEFEQQIRDDRPAFFENFGKQFFGVGFLSHPVSDAILQWTNALIYPASQKAIIDCARAFASTDFRIEAATLNIPALIIHGDADKIVPIKTAGEQAAQLIKGSLYKVYPDAPHGTFYTNKRMLNNDIVDFITTGSVNTENVIPEGLVVLPSNEPLVTREEGI